MSARRGGPGGRGAAVRVRTAKGRPVSSTLWLRRQLNDPYVAEAKRLGYRSRAAFKLVELDDRFGLLKPGLRVLDLGAAPGGWTQVAVERVGPKGKVLGVDILPMEAIAGATTMQHDFMADDAPKRIEDALGGPVDVVLSDMAAPTTGHKATDHLRIVAMAEAAADFAMQVLRPGGAFLCKVFQGGTEGTLLAELKRHFAKVVHAKPKASRAESAELYVVATGYKGRASP
jgi:23S rRNA (uridine2552-2'-O)-methyltransferase